MNLLNIGTIGTFLLFSLISTVLLKKGFDSVGDVKLSINFLLRWLTNPAIFTSLVLAFACRLLYYRLQGPLGATGTFLVLGGLNYIIIIAGNWLLLGEALKAGQIFGSILIISGIIVFGVT